MLKETETDETIDFFVTFLSLVAFQFGGGPGPLPRLWLRRCPVTPIVSSYIDAYSKKNFATTVNSKTEK